MPTALRNLLGTDVTNQTHVLQVSAGDAHTVLLVKDCLAYYPVSGTYGHVYARVKWRPQADRRQRRPRWST